MTPGANSKAIANGRLGVDVPGNGRVLPVDFFEDAQNMAVRCSVVSPHPPSGSVANGVALALQRHRTNRDQR